MINESRDHTVRWLLIPGNLKENSGRSRIYNLSCSSVLKQRFTGWDRHGKNSQNAVDFIFSDKQKANYFYISVKLKLHTEDYLRRCLFQAFICPINCIIFDFKSEVFVFVCSFSSVVKNSPYAHFMSRGMKCCHHNSCWCRLFFQMRKKIIPVLRLTMMKILISNMCVSHSATQSKIKLFWRVWKEARGTMCFLNPTLYPSFNN